MLRRQVVLDLSVAMGAFAITCIPSEHFFPVSQELSMICACSRTARLTVNCRSWCDRWLWLVVRYVHGTLIFIAAYDVLCTSRLEAYFSKVTTFPPSATATLSTRSSRTIVPQPLARNKRQYLTKQALLCSKMAKMYRGLLELGPDVS